MIEHMQQISENEYKFDFSGARRAGPSASSSFNVNGNNKFIIAVDMDEILVNINNKWFSKIRQNHILADYLNSHHISVLDKESNLRSEYYLASWMGVTLQEHRDMLLELYFNDEKFYDDLTPLPYMIALHKCQEIFSEIHIVSKCSESLSSGADISKLKWLARYFESFTNTSIRFHMLPFSTSKGRYMEENGIRPNTFVDDHVNNHVEFMKYTTAQNPELVLPLYGYNSHLPAALDAMEEKKPYRLEVFHNMTTMTTEEMTEYFRPKNVV